MRFRTPRLALTGYALAVACLVLHVLGIGLLPLPALGYPLFSSLVAALAWAGWRRHDQLVLRLDASMAALSGAMAREHVLSELGTAMLGATDAAHVHRLAADAATAVLAGCGNVRTAIVVAAPDRDAWIVARAAGHDAEALIGVEVPGAVVPASLVTRLAAGEALADDAGWSGLGLPGLERVGGRPLMVLPLVNGERFFGLLTVATDEALPDDVVKALHTLRSQVSLALESVALTAELIRRAMYDMLTGLGNRALLRDRLTGALARSRRTARPVGVLLLDLNGFKAVNDTYGHDAGDMLLKVVADRLRTCVRTEDMVARLGGDEFVVVAEDLREPQDVLVVAERIIEALNEPVVLDGHLLRTPASVGIALSTQGNGPDDVLRAADAAMYVAKRQGDGRFHLHAAVLS
ncbi:sensor domain-containing diguanylate cyclase [Actinoplanes sp. L3-i22]|uniref:sensor domain-containing diguanylate cyclase n=1 Tax=Actinoplanes sp. L3-i22 TaxID=2836373 RepID=UPI001C855075|nr:sensor domain-containing diguanylate cyclase [Actinoplanes sp. L3-i22]